MYRVIKIMVGKGHKMHGYFQDICQKSKNLYNVSNFMIRQNMTGLKKSEGERQPNEKEAIQKTIDGIAKLNLRRQENYGHKIQKILSDGNLSNIEKQHALDKVKQPIMSEYPTAEKWFLGYNELEGILRLTDDADYRALPAQVAQHSIKICIQNWNSYFSALKEYKRHPDRFLGKPRIPKYKEGMETAAFFSNQACAVKFNGNGKAYLRFPATKRKLWLGKAVAGDMKLKQVDVMPKHGAYEVALVLEDSIQVSEIPENHVSKNIASIDLGVDNLAAITDNTGNRPVIVKGGVLKSRNQWCNKKAAQLQARLVRDGDNRVVDCPKNHSINNRISRLWGKRDRFFNDYFHKAAKEIIKLLKSRNIDTLVVGHNKGWKQNADMGKRNNQNFVQIPFTKFTGMLEYLCRREGIRYIESEESYTSKASFLNGDPIPVYGDKEIPAFSGKRVCRGLYQSKDGTIINADVNASLNILRKAFPDAGICQDLSSLMNPEVWNFHKFYQCSPDARILARV